MVVAAAEDLIRHDTTAATLWTQIRSVLAQLGMVSSAPVARLGSGGGEGEASTSVWSPEGRIRFRLDGAGRQLQRKLDASEAIGDMHERQAAVVSAYNWYVQTLEDILRAARDELAQLTGRDGRPPVSRRAQLDEPGELQRMIVEEGEGWPVEDVARRYRIAEAFVRRLRVRGDCEPDFGYPVNPSFGSIAERREKVSEMHGRGITNRQIAQLLKVDEGTVRNDLRAMREAA